MENQKTLAIELVEMIHERAGETPYGDSQMTVPQVLADALSYFWAQRSKDIADPDGLQTFLECIDDHVVMRVRQFVEAVGEMAAQEDENRD